MKFWCFLILAVFATCEATSTLESIAKRTHARLISNVPVRKAFAAQIKPKVGEEDGPTETTTAAPEPCVEGEFKCKNDKLIFCHPLTGEPQEEACGNFFTSKLGYCNCDGNDCLSAPPTNCPRPPQSGGPCKTNGELTPDPDNCKRFSYCDAKELVHYECEDNLVYNPLTKECTIGTCRTVRCPTTPSVRPVYVTFPQDESWYLLCYKGERTIGQCAKGLSSGPTGCIFKCKSYGRFPDPKSDTSYYSCSGLAPNYKKTLINCPEGKIFDSTTKICKTKP